jgi:hypothetical protein
MIAPMKSPSQPRRRQPLLHQLRRKPSQQPPLLQSRRVTKKTRSPAMTMHQRPSQPLAQVPRKLWRRKALMMKTSPIARTHQQRRLPQSAHAPRHQRKTTRRMSQSHQRSHLLASETQRSGVTSRNPHAGLKVTDDVVVVTLEEAAVAGATEVAGAVVDLVVTEAAVVGMVAIVVALLVAASVATEVAVEGDAVTVVALDVVDDSNILSKLYAQHQCLVCQTLSAGRGTVTSQGGQVTGFWSSRVCLCIDVVGMLCVDTSWPRPAEV